MSNPGTIRGGAPVGYVSELSALEAASVIYLRLWCSGAEKQEQVWNDFRHALGIEPGRAAMNAFEDLCGLCAKHARRPMMRHSVECKCLGSDESCFANFIALATEGAHEDAMLVATLLVRPDMAPAITALATDVGLALKRMRLSAPKDLAQRPPMNRTLH